MAPQGKVVVRRMLGAFTEMIEAQYQWFPFQPLEPE
jgi:hypothetical protein